MSRLYIALAQMIERSRKIRNEQGALSNHRDRASRIAAQAIQGLFRNLPRGLSQFSPEWLGHPETTYLRIDLRGPEGNITNHQKLTLTRIGFVERDGERFAVDLDRNVDLGLVNAHSFRQDWLNEPDWMKYNNHPQYRRVWKDLHFHDHDRPSDALLVLTGPMLAHKAIAKMAQFAASVRAGGQAETAPLNAFDREQAKFRQTQDEIEAAALKAAAIYPDLAGLASQHPALVRDLKSMDWSYDQADRPSRASGDQETRIRAGLAELSLDDAAALFVANNTIYWQHLLSYLQRHPELLRIAA